MHYSIFQNTMADMTYQQIEKAAEKKLPVLFPIAVIEAHGPHMCLGTDTYLTYNLCKNVQNELFESGSESLIAPPFYWGVNSITDQFAGSFTVKPKTMISVLCDSLECMKKWGFDRIFLISLHGDFVHGVTILESVRKAYEELDVGAYFIVPFMPPFFLERAGITEKKPYIIDPSGPLVPNIVGEKPPEYMDVHAGGLETSLMVKDFEGLVDVELAKSLRPSLTTLDELKIWERGGKQAREVTPLAYLGNPSDIRVKAVAAFENEMVATIVKAIKDLLQQY